VDSREHGAESSGTARANVGAAMGIVAVGIAVCFRFRPATCPTKVRQRTVLDLDVNELLLKIIESTQHSRAVNLALWEY
jgi:hypothetical protein